jgi:hypothetical protein
LAPKSSLCEPCDLPFNKKIFENICGQYLTPKAVSASLVTFRLIKRRNYGQCLAPPLDGSLEPSVKVDLFLKIRVLVVLVK